MAKQRGVVQLSGRVDNLCYYQQKRVKGGLVRRVNLAMSERVKTGSEYSRLRLANSFWGACSMCASAIIQMTGSRADFLHLGDRQAILTKEIYQFQKEVYPNITDSAVTFKPSDGLAISLCYEKIVKNKMSKFFPSVPFVRYSVPIGANLVITIPSAELDSYCRFYKCAGVQFTIVPECFIYSTSKSSDTQKYGYPECGSGSDRGFYSWLIGDGDLDLTPAVSVNDDAANFVIIIAMPIVRQIGGRNVTKLSGATARLIGAYVI